MNFIRPEARAAIWRWREVALGLLVVALGLNWALGFGVLKWMGVALVAVGVMLTLAGAQRARVRPRGGQAPGVIELDERQLSYMAPGGGVIILLEAVTRIEIETSDQGPFEDDMFWLFHQAGVPTARIPASALGNDKLFDALAAFRGADYEKVIAASGSTGNARFLIWTKNSTPEVRRLH